MKKMNFLLVDNIIIYEVCEFEIENKYMSNYLYSLNINLGNSYY